MNARIINLFYVSVATMLFLTAAAKLYSAMGVVQILSRYDPILRVNNRVLMVALGLLELGIAIYLLVARGHATDVKRAVTVLWLSTNFIAYRAVILLTGVAICPCLGTLTSKLPLTRELIDQLLAAFVLYWFFGSALILWLGRAGKLDVPQTWRAHVDPN